MKATKSGKKVSKQETNTVFTRDSLNRLEIGLHSKPI